MPLMVPHNPKLTHVATPHDHKTRLCTLQLNIDGSWSQGRSRVPDALHAFGVPQTVWEYTYDEMQQFSNDFPHQPAVEVLAKVGWILLCISLCFGLALPIVEDHSSFFKSHDAIAASITLCFLTLGMGLLMMACCRQSPRTTAWLDLWKKQSDIYKRYSIEIQTIVMSRNGRGLAFYPLNPSLRNHLNQPSISQELEALHQLHQKGGLTDKEYNKAKSIVLGMSSNHQPQVIEPGDDEHGREIV